MKHPKDQCRFSYANEYASISIKFAPSRLKRIVDVFREIGAEEGRKREEGGKIEAETPRPVP